jgi:hypothetical protein
VGAERRRAPGEGLPELGAALFAACERRVERLEAEAAGAAGPPAAAEAPPRALASAWAAAEAIDEALAGAGELGPESLEPVLDAIAEAVYLDGVMRERGSAGAVDEVLTELAWQREHLRSLLRAPVCGAAAPHEHALRRLHDLVASYDGSRRRSRAVLRGLIAARRAGADAQALAAVIDDLDRDRA